MTSVHLQWHPGHAAGALGLDARALGWVLEPGSMTARLRRDFPALAVRVEAQGLAAPMPDESVRLELPAGAQAWIRQVTLHAGDAPLLQARTVVPRWSARNPWAELQRLGDQPLGELLFRLPGLGRTPFEVALCTRWPRNGVIGQVAPRPARRCVFVRDGAPLLLTEQFPLLATEGPPG